MIGFMRYSLVVPHYNDALRLERLLKSIPLDRPDIEVLVVDDCSPGQTDLSSLAARWPMVRWLTTQRNAGAGAARNVGLARARGARLVFADSDDEFLPGAFDVFDRHVGHDDELVYFLAEAVQEVDGAPSNRADRMNGLCRAYLASPSVSSLERLKLGHVNPVAKVYMRQFIERCQIRFEEVRINNDVAFNVLAAVQAERIRVVPVPVYRVFRRTGSLISGGDEVGNLKLGVQTLARLNDQLAALNVAGRMHAGSHLYRALRRGPLTFVEVFREVLSRGLFWPTLRRLSVSEVFSFIRRITRDRLERSRL